MAQCRSNTKVKDCLRGRGTTSGGKDGSGGEEAAEPRLPADGEDSGPHTPGRPRPTSSVTLRSQSRADSQPVPDVGSTGPSPTTHSNMKTKQAKDELDRSIDEETAVEPKTRQARKKASDISEEDKKSTQDEPKTSKEPRKTLKPKAVVKKRPLGIRKALRSKKVVTAKGKVKNAIKQTVTRGRKAAVKTEPDNSHEKEAVPLIPASEIKKEPVDDTSPNSRSSSPKTAGRRQRLTSDKIMMKSVLGDSPSSLVLGPRTSPYSMRSERSNSPSLVETKNLRSGKPRKVKNNLLNEVVMKEQKKRRRLLSDSKASDAADGPDDKRPRRGRSCSRDGSEISKCSDITESDASLNETLAETDGKELNKKLEKPKTDLDLDFENNVQISITEKVPSLVDPKSTERPDSVPSCNISEKSNRNTSLTRSTSLDSDNNNSDRLKLDNLNSSDVEDKNSRKTEKDTLLEARSSILTSMSRTFNSKEVAKNIRKARRGRKVAAAARAAPAPADKLETLETLSKEIDDLINNLDQNIDRDHELAGDAQTKSVSKFYGLSKPLGDNNSIAPDALKDKDADGTPTKNDDSENIRLHYEEDSVDNPKPEISYKVSTVASIDKLMDRLKVFEEFDKKRQRQESESKSTDKTVMLVTNDVVLIPKSGADIKPLKDVQSVRSPEPPIEKENVLSCFENNSAISIVKRDQVRKSIDIDLPNSVTLIKRNSFSSRKESTSSNHSKESDAISIFEKSLGKDVTLTEIRKSSVDKSAAAPVELHQFATLHPNHSNASLKGVTLDTSQVSITPRAPAEREIRRSRESKSRQSSESAVETEEKMATIEKIKSPPQQIKSPPPPLKSPPLSIKSPPLQIKSPPPQVKSPPPQVKSPPPPVKSPPPRAKSPPPPVAVKSPEVQPMETEALAPPLEDVKTIPEDISLASEIPVDSAMSEAREDAVLPEKLETKPEVKDEEKLEEKVIEKAEEVKAVEPEVKTETPVESKPETVETKPVRSPGKRSKSARNSTENQPGPSNALNETPESQKRKESVLRTLGLLTHKAAKEAKKLKEKQRVEAMKKKKEDYTGTLKTVIKLNRTGEKKKHRSSLKMTFQKSKHRGKPAPEPGEGTGEDDAYYTIERREGFAAAGSEGGHRKPYSNRLNNHAETETAPEPAEAKETLNLVIPEKASSFSIHPGRLCQDQCFYCGGRFGLFDTPCHIAQMKSGERQKKVLDSEERLTIDSCLCDACYRHVDRRANCPSYKRAKPDAGQPAPSKPASPSGGESEPEGAARCHAAGCGAPAARTLRRKWLARVRRAAAALLKLEPDAPQNTLSLCAAHHSLLAPLLACALCRRRLAKHGAHELQQGHEETNQLLRAQGVPASLSATALLCKSCRCYAALLRRQGHDKQAAVYRRRLLQVYNVEVPPESETEEDPTSDERRKKPRGKGKRKSCDRSASPDTAEPTDKPEPQKPIEEDIESLISSNKIPVPAKTTDPEEDYDMEPVLDKQTELQMLLQKQNNPAQFLHTTNLTQKHRNLLKGVQKPGLQQRINDKNARRLHKLGQMIVQKDKAKKDDLDIFEPEKDVCMKNVSLNEECTIESIPNKKPADIAALKNKWQQSESFTQVKKNLSELSKKLTVVKEPKNTSDSKYSNPVRRLETNPSISVRELFPGEEEMNLQCNIDFGNVKGVTPEGWEKCSTTIQYDLETKKLWNELQRPYGNQSSFLRHLTLLEKYFRNGDLVLSHNATPSAANYSDSVQSRLRAYDNVVNETPRRSEPAISLIEFRKKPSVNGKSLLKTNQGAEGESPKQFMLPPPPLPKPKAKEKKNKPLPPELIAINTPNAQGRKAIQNVLHNIQQLVKGVSASDPTEVAAAPLPLPPVPVPPIPLPPVLPVSPAPPVPPPAPKEKKEKPDTPKKKTTSKPWRPTLMPITPENLARVAREPIQVAVDGRRLPSLVKVMSSGKQFHITLQDYNKMCVMRREKLQQLGHDDKPRDAVVTEVQTSAMLGNGGTVLQVPADSPEKKDLADLAIPSNAATILKNVGLKNITIAPITPKTATVTSQTFSTTVASPLLATTPLRAAPAGPGAPAGERPRLPRALTVIPHEPRP